MRRRLEDSAAGLHHRAQLAVRTIWKLTAVSPRVNLVVVNLHGVAGSIHPGSGAAKQLLLLLLPDSWIYREQVKCSQWNNGTRNLRLLPTSALKSFPVNDDTIVRSASASSVSLPPHHR